MYLWDPFGVSFSLSLSLSIYIYIYVPMDGIFKGSIYGIYLFW